MNRHALARTVRSLYFRRHLAKAIPTIEDAVRTELVTRQLASAKIGGFLVRLSGNTLSIEPAEITHRGQLRLTGIRGNPNPNDSPQQTDTQGGEPWATSESSNKSFARC